MPQTATPPLPPRTILLRADAPPMPSAGVPCNGCGVCCAVEPCPLGIVLSRRRRGRCVALRWDGQARRYRCGAVATPRRFLPWLPPALAGALARRWIGAGVGCDAAFETRRG